MRERLFPRWGAALFALLPLSETLYTRIDGQTVYAAALASLICALVCAGGAYLAPLWRQYRVLQWALALFALWPLTHSVARMALFLSRTVFPNRALWGLAAIITLSVLSFAPLGLNRCAMWALPVASITGLLLVLSAALTAGELHPAYWQAPGAGVVRQTGTILRALLPAALALSISLPERLSGAAARGLSAGGALFALLSLRAALLLGAHTSALLPYPNFAAAGLASFGDFAQHGEVFFAVPLLLCDLGRAAALLCAVLLPATRSFGVLRAQKKDA